jgi:phytoene synthase
MDGASSPESGSNFRLGFLFLPKRKREALSAVYAFCRHVDDIVDSGELPAEEAARRLDTWRRDIERLYAGGASAASEPPAHPLAGRLKPFIEEFRLPKEGFLEVLRGVGMDLDKKRYEDFDELSAYLFGVAGAVGLLCVEIFGHRSTPPDRLREYAVAMGNAFQLTNILRDVGGDLERGRVYLPLADIREAGCSVESIFRREHTPAFERLMEAEYRRAKGYYARARALLHPDDRRGLAAAEVMAGIYEGLLERIREERYRVLFGRVRLSGWSKAWLAARGWARSALKSGPAVSVV